MFKVGDRVKIGKDSQYYKEKSRTNPRDKEGVISDVYEKDLFCYGVVWVQEKHDVISNTYRLNDLELTNQEDSYSIY